MANLRVSLLITFFASNGSTIVHLGVTMALARLLTPAEIGIFSITAVLVGIAHIFRDFGVSSYLEQEKELTPEKVASAFGVLIASSWGLAVTIYLLAPIAAHFYGEAGVKEVMQVLAIGFLFIPLGSITNTLLTREYRAKEQVYVTLVSTTVYAATAISLANAGFGYMSMAWANLANILSMGIALSFFRPKGMPWLPSLSGWKKAVGFGSGAVLSNTLNTVNNAIPDLLLGKLSGAHDVGIMSRSVSTTGMMSQVLGPTVNYAALPYLARVHHGKHSMEFSLGRAISYVTAIMWAALVFIYFNAEDIVLLLYGNQWTNCAPIIKILCLAAFVMTPFTFESPAYMAIGRPYLPIFPAATIIIAKLTLVGILYDGSLESFAGALAGATLIYAPIQIWMHRKFLNFSAATMLRSVWRSGVIASVCIVCLALWSATGIDVPMLVDLPAQLVILSLAWITTVFILDHPIKHEIKAILSRLKPN